MMTMVLVSGIIARIALTVAFYLLGVRFGAYVSFNEQIANCRLQEELLHTAREFERSHSQITISSSSAVSNLQDCIPIHKSSYPLHHGMSCRHAYEERRNLSVLHLAKVSCIRCQEMIAVSIYRLVDHSVLGHCTRGRILLPAPPVVALQMVLLLHPDQRVAVERRGVAVSVCRDLLNQDRLQV